MILLFKKNIYQIQEYNEIAKRVRKHYFDNDPIDESTKPQYLDMENDIVFYYPIYKSLKRHVEYSKGRTFFFQYVFITTVNRYKISHFYCFMFFLIQIFHKFYIEHNETDI